MASPQKISHDSITQCKLLEQIQNQGVENQKSISAALVLIQTGGVLVYSYSKIYRPLEKSIQALQQSLEEQIRNFHSFFYDADPSSYPRSSFVLPSVTADVLRKTVVLVAPFPISYFQIKRKDFSKEENEPTKRLFQRTQLEILGFIEAEWRRVNKAFFAFVRTLEGIYSDNLDTLVSFYSGGHTAAREEPEPDLDNKTPRKENKPPSSRAAVTRPASPLDRSEILTLTQKDTRVSEQDNQVILTKKPDQKQKITQALLAGAFKSRSIFFSLLNWKSTLRNNSKALYDGAIHQNTYLSCFGWHKGLQGKSNQASLSFYEYLCKETAKVTLQALGIAAPTEALQATIENCFKADLDQGWEVFHAKEMLRAFIHLFLPDFIERHPLSDKAIDTAPYFLEQDLNDPIFNSIRDVLKSLQFYLSFKKVPQKHCENLFWMIWDRDKKLDEDLQVEGLPFSVTYKAKYFEPVCMAGKVSFEEEKGGFSVRPFFQKGTFSFLVFCSEVESSKRNLIPLDDPENLSLFIKNTGKGWQFLRDSLDIVFSNMHFLNGKFLFPAVLNREKGYFAKEGMILTDELGCEIIRLIWAKIIREKGGVSAPEDLLVVCNEEDRVISLLRNKHKLRHTFAGLYKAFKELSFLRVSPDQVASFIKENAKFSFLLEEQILGFFRDYIIWLHKEARAALREINGGGQGEEDGDFPLERLMFVPPVTLRFNNVDKEACQQKLHLFKNLSTYLNRFREPDYGSIKVIRLLRRVVLEGLDTKCFTLLNFFYEDFPYTADQALDFLLDLPSGEMTENAIQEWREAMRFFNVCMVSCKNKGEILPLAPRLLKKEIAHSHFILFSLLPEWITLGKQDVITLLGRATKFNPAAVFFDKASPEQKKTLISLITEDISLLKEKRKEALSSIEYAELFYEWFYLALQAEISKEQLSVIVRAKSSLSNWLLTQLPKCIDLSPNEMESLLASPIPSIDIPEKHIRRLASDMKREVLFLQKTYKEGWTNFQYAQIFYEWFYLFLAGKGDSIGEAKCFLTDLQEHVGIFPARYAFMLLKGFPKAFPEKRENLRKSFRKCIEMGNNPELDSNRFILNPSIVSSLYEAIQVFTDSLINTEVIELGNLSGTLNYALRVVTLPSSPQFITDLMKIVAWDKKNGPVYLEEQVSTHRGVTNYPLGNQKEVLALGSSAEWIQDGNNLDLRISYSKGGSSESVLVSFPVPIQIMLEGRFTLLRLLVSLLQEEVDPKNIHWNSYISELNKFEATSSEWLSCERKAARQCFTNAGMILRLYEYGLFKDPYYYHEAWKEVLSLLSRAELPKEEDKRELLIQIKQKTRCITDAIPTMLHGDLARELQELEKLQMDFLDELTIPENKKSLFQTLFLARNNLRMYLEGEWMKLPKHEDRALIFKVIELTLKEDTRIGPKFKDKELSSLDKLLDRRVKTPLSIGGNYAREILHFIMKVKIGHRNLVRRFTNRGIPQGAFLSHKLREGSHFVRDGIPCLITPFNTAYDPEYFFPLCGENPKKPLKERILEARNFFQEETEEKSFPLPMKVFLREDCIYSLPVFYKVKALKASEEEKISDRDSVKVTMKVRVKKETFEETLVFPYSCINQVGQENYSAFIRLYSKQVLDLLSRVHNRISSSRGLEEEEKKF